MTNLERMQAGKPPIGSDGKPIQLHHILQKEAEQIIGQSTKYPVGYKPTIFIFTED